MATFLFSMVAAVLVNLVTAFFSRRNALRLIPWFCLYIGIYGSIVAVHSKPAREFSMTLAQKCPSWWSYVIVAIGSSLLAIVYWHSVRKGAALLDHVTQPTPSIQADNLPSGATPQVLSEKDKLRVVQELLDQFRSKHPEATSAKRANAVINQQLEQQKADFRVEISIAEPDRPVAIRVSHAKNFSMNNVTTSGPDSGITFNDVEGVKMKNVHVQLLPAPK
jgi:hypothetical protein